MKAVLIEKDKQISEWLYSKGRNKIIRKLTFVIAHSGDPYIWLPVSTAFWYWGDSFMKDVMFRQIIIAFILMLCSTVFKYTFRRPRPSYPSSSSLYYAKSLDKYSLPSGHAVRSGSLVISIGVALPVTLWFLIPWGILIVLSRVTAGAHHIFDVIVGFLFGSITTLIIIIFWTI